MPAQPLKGGRHLARHASAESGHASQDQSQVFGFLADPQTHNLGGPVKVINTHAAAVFLAGPNVYKVKRAVKFPFMDLSTLPKRRRACQAEFAVNRKYAPDLYLGILPITRGKNRLVLGGKGRVVEWVVHLKRFDETRTLDHVAEDGGLDDRLLRKLTETVLATYAEAEIRDGGKATGALQGVVNETLAAIAAMPQLFAVERITVVAEAMRAALSGVRELLLQRGANGLVRRCHGDLHLRNIALIDDVPTLFDAIEFDESIATTDILYDFAFLLMDLWERRFRREANRLLNRYLWAAPDQAGELAGLSALPLFLALRAAVRAKVDGLRYLDVEPLDETRADAQRYFAAAEAFLKPSSPKVIAIGGLSGSGKSSLAASIAAEMGRPPGAVHLRSDILRKRLFGVPEFEQLPKEAYGREVTDRVFATLCDQTELAVGAGQSVIVDAVHRLPSERQLIAAAAGRSGAAFAGIWLDAPPATLIRRVSSRIEDVSDATAEIVTQQTREPLDPVEWTRLDASASLEAVSGAALKVISGISS